MDVVAFANFGKVSQSLPILNRCYSSKNDLVSIKSWLSEFKGGSIDLTRPEKYPDIAVVTWSNPGLANVFTGYMISELGNVVNELDLNPPKGVIFRGANGTYCSGGELNFFSRIANPKDGYKFSKYMHFLTNRITSMETISVSLVEGAAVSGGAELILCSDYRLATPSSFIQFAQREFGVTTGWGGGARLVRLLQREKAMLTMLRCNKIDSKEALDLKLIDHIVSSDDSNDALSECEQWLGDLVDPVPTPLLRSIKHLVNYIDYRDTQDALDEELSIFSRVWGGMEQETYLRHLRDLAKRPI